MPRDLRRDFPILSKRFDNGRLVYLDNACSTLKPRPVMDAVQAYYEEFPVCGGRSQHRLGREVSRRVESGRKALAGFIGARDPAHVVYTKNTTESINLVAHALPWKKGDVVVTTDKEHNSNWVPWLHLRDTKGVEVRTIPSRADGTFDESAMDRVFAKAGDRLRLVSVHHVSNADGVAVPIQAVAKAAHERDALVLLDAAQSAPHQKLDVSKLGADLVAASLHKMMGPSGLGFLWGRPEAWGELGPFMLGGSTVKSSRPDGFVWDDLPNRYEAGLQNYAALSAVEATVEYLSGVGMDAIAANDRALNRDVTKRLGEIPGVTVHGPGPDQRGSIVPFTVDGVDAQTVASFLDEQSNVAIRAGAHCVHSYFVPRGIAGGWARASVHAYNTKEDGAALVAGLRAIRERLVVP